MGTLHILMIVAKPDENKTFSDEEIEQGSLATFFSKICDDDRDRQKEIGRYPESIKD